MSLNDAIVGMNAYVFSDENFAEEVTYVPQGVAADQFTINAVVDWGDEEGQNQIRGEGRASINQDRGRSVRGTVKVELPTTRRRAGQTVEMVVSENGRDRIVVTKPGTSGSVRLSVKRIIGRDAGSITVLCHFETEHAAQPRKSRFG